MTYKQNRARFSQPSIYVLGYEAHGNKNALLNPSTHTFFSSRGVGAGVVFRSRPSTGFACGEPGKRGETQSRSGYCAASYTPHQSLSLYILCLLASQQTHTYSTHLPSTHQDQLECKNSRSAPAAAAQCGRHVSLYTISLLVTTYGQKRNDSQLRNGFAGSVSF